MEIFTSSTEESQSQVYDSELTSYDPLTVTRLPPCQPNHEDDTSLGQERTHHDLEPLQE